MNRLPNILIGLICLVLGVYACSRLVYPTVIINYRLTLEAITPDGPKKGSGVIQVSYGSEFNLNGGSRRGIMRVSGEAVPVDLGQGKILLATLTNNASGRISSPAGLDGALNAEFLPVKIFGLDWNWGEEYKLPRQVDAARNSGPKDVPLLSLPTLITFKHINDPSSVELIHPENIMAIFGEGYTLTKAELELTDDPPTEGIEKVLGWIKTNAGPFGGDEFEQAHPERYLSVYDLKRSELR